MDGMILKGAVDRLDGDGAVGWFYGSEYSEPPTIHAFLHHELIGQGVADSYRPDLEQVGFGDGRCGFDVRFDRFIDPAYLPMVSIRPRDVDLQLLAPSSSAAYMDVIGTAFSAHAGSGRSRSVLGGLWTDRTDAPQVLAGRIAVGACAADLQPALQELIRGGHVVLHHGLAPNGVSARDETSFRLAASPDAAAGDEAGLRAALGNIANLLFRDGAVRILRAAFDDQPVVYRIETVSGRTEFAQVSASDASPSPGECAAIYVGNSSAPVRLELVRDSHELPEFGPDGLSRWTAAGGRALSRFAAEAGLSIETVELGPLDLAIVGPGLMHRVVADADAPAFRAVVAPRRVTPARFLSGEQSWVEVNHVSGARIRI
ncbi:MAG: hypothetical protein INR65_12255 [Gluconacetobacter diazotrophicus]|nr:hypothetical protein [Gluconacetobacter diazotrophicus]